MFSWTFRRLSAAAAAASSGAPLGFQVLFPEPTFSTTEADLSTALQGFDSALTKATVSIKESNDEGMLGVCSWTDSTSLERTVRHRVDLIARHRCPLPTSIADGCVTYASYAEEVKKQIKAAQSTVYLTYHATEDRVHPLEQYTALCAVAGALCQLGAAGVLNVNSRTSAPPKLFDKEVIQTRMKSDRTLNFFRALPFLIIYCGFVPFRPGDKPGFGFRTFGAQHIGLPNLAAFSKELTPTGDVVYRSFQGVWELMIAESKALQPGHTFDLTESPQSKVLVRAPTEAEPYILDPADSVLVLEPVEGWDSITLPAS